MVRIGLLSLEESYYYANNLYKKRKYKRAKFWMLLANIIHSSDIDYRACIGGNIKFGHRGIGIVIHKNSVIGDNCHIMHNVTIGGKNGFFPVVGNNVFIGLGSTVLGNVTLGDNSTVGAMSLVLHDVNEGDTVVGSPAKKINH